MMGVEGFLLSICNKVIEGKKYYTLLVFMFVFIITDHQKKAEQIRKSDIYIYIYYISDNVI